MQQIRCGSIKDIFLHYSRNSQSSCRLKMTAPGTSDSSQAMHKELVVQNKMGIHARPAAMIVRVANTYSGEVWVEKDDEQVNGKSIMGLMMLAAGKGSKLRIKADGPADEGLKMLEEMSALFERRFEEA